MGAKKTKKLFGVSISDGVYRQIERRKKLVSSNNKSLQETNLLNNKGAWLRMTSGVNVVVESQQENYRWLKTYDDGTDSFKEEKEKIISNLKKTGNAPAKENVLHGGTLAITTKNDKRYFARRGNINFDGSEQNGMYSQDPIYGFSPMAGITGFSVKSVSSYGALKEVELTILAHNQNQLDTIDMLYLRPGYDMLVEWGNSAYIDVDGNISTAFNSVFKEFLKGSSQTSIYDTIDEHQISSGYNYDAIIGKVINYSWNMTPEGTYECSVKLIGRGELIESLTSNKYSTRKNPLLNPAKKNTPVGSSDFDDFDALSTMLRAMQFANNESAAEFKKAVKGYDKMWLYKTPVPLKADNVQDGQDTSDEENKNYHWFVSLRDLMASLNALYLDKNEETGDAPVKFSTDFNKSSYLTFDWHLSANPGVCIVPSDGVTGFDGEAGIKENGGYVYYKNEILGDPGDANKRLVHYYSYQKMNELFTYEEIDFNSPLTLLVNINYLLSLQNKLLEEKKKNSQKEFTIIVLLKKLLEDMSTSMGGINAFDMHLDEGTNEWHVVDRVIFGPSDEKVALPRIDIIGLKSMVTNFSLQSKISNAIANQLSIGASRAGLNQRSNEALLQFNKELVNRWNVTPPSGVTLTKTEETDEITSLLNNIERIKEYNTGTWTEKNAREYVGYYRTFAEVISAKERQRKRISNKPTFYPGLLPLELSISMDGISGLKIGEAFTINSNVLPTRYADKVAFVITQLSHDITDTNRWETHMTCKMFNLPATQIATEKEKRELEERKAFSAEQEKAKEDKKSCEQKWGNQTFAKELQKWPALKGYKYTGSNPADGLTFQGKPLTSFARVNGGGDRGDLPTEGYGIARKLFEQVVKIAEEAKKQNLTLTINSHYRSPVYNCKIGGVNNSLHKVGAAMDLGTSNPKKLYRLITSMVSSGKILQGGVGRYSNFVHYDIRGSYARWSK